MPRERGPRTRRRTSEAECGARREAGDEEDVEEGAERAVFFAAVAPTSPQTEPERAARSSCSDC